VRLRRSAGRPPPDGGDAASRCALALASSLEPGAALAAFARELRVVVPFDRAELVVVEDGRAHVLATEGVGAEAVVPAGSRRPLEGTLLEAVLGATDPATGGRVTARHLPETSALARLGLRSRLAVPLVSDAATIGMLALARRDPGGFSSFETELFGRIGALCAAPGQNLRAHDQACRAVAELRRNAVRRAEFVALVAHDLRTPLAAVIGSVQTLQQRGHELTPEQRDSLLTVIAHEADRLAGLVGEVFDTSRIDADSFTYSFADVDVAALVEESVAAATAGGEVEVVPHVADELPAVRGDRARLRQLLANLIDNAVKYSPSGAAVEVGASAANGRVVVRVTDHGEGITPEDQELIFERFGRVQGTSQPGTGLGLYISRTIAEAHGGSLGVSSAPGRGSTFTLTLPPA
jgi:signal transduction histidine kinase